MTSQDHHSAPGGAPPDDGHQLQGTPRPGTDETAVSMPHGYRRCANLDHGIAGTPAHVVVKFGPLSPHGRTVLFAGCARRSYPLCADCWEATRLLADNHHISLIIPIICWP
jgi:hypothetical protein